ncbi:MULTISPECIES: 4-hydroxyphenylpyruvate dioxygenase [unclassified Streptomyces]|uniref:4-hydroxyphenylpyruvate dioxygenase n=1 Tax=unclassified Streptomyces TaxID=2593676 RepID=UPI001BE90CD2|nr:MULTISPECIES: 4-hydroxyphenylpyruvate dioxygenase [unclassified Streptomyces]MBT2408575.1 4-hydroxyphenylpyruvate dioxygenase [Streptomyces sp. ISL-21]MBT2458194.1 4-hydroxyphenylpyruvate dioxygenase [Streptomyces sp. ISL-86]MBT2608741.1 4-hydroxyphenylpyruvate dioxygenase [Streptomyces sp. ISL-87]
MTTGRDRGSFDLDYIEMYVEDLGATLGTWCDQYGFRRVAVGGSPETGFRSVVLRHGGMSLVLTEATSLDHPAADYVKSHGDGVVDIAMRAPDVRQAYETVVAAGGTGLVEPWDPEEAEVALVSKVAGFGDVVHTLLQREEPSNGIPVGYRETEGASAQDTSSYEVVAPDHFAVIVSLGQLDSTVEFYERAFGFDEIFAERIVIGAQAMLSKVVQSASRTVTFTILAPDPSAATGQISDFLSGHGGPGVQHVALAVDDIVRAVTTLAERDVKFLSTPDAYYARLPDRVPSPRHAVQRLHELNILVDEDHGGQLFQIFTRSTHPRRTLFFEVIERRGARTFGSSNIKALYEAVEGERVASS